MSNKPLLNKNQAHDQGANYSLVMPVINYESINETVKGVLIAPKEGDDQNPNNRELSFSTRDVSRQNVNLESCRELPLARHLGIPLPFKEWKVTTNTEKSNFFVETMSIDPDFSREKKDIVSKGFPTTVNNQIFGGIMVLRVDGKVLNDKDIEALWEYVRTEFPRMDALSAIATPTLRFNRSYEVESTGKAWRSKGKSRKFAEWWYGWRDRQVQAGHDEYKSLECPVADEASPSLPMNAAYGALAVGGTMRDRCCPTQ